MEHWQELAHISSRSGRRSKWVRQRIVLSDYRGKNVNFRWRYSAVDFTGSGGALDNILVEEAPVGGKAFINVSFLECG